MQGNTGKLQDIKNIVGARYLRQVFFINQSFNSVSAAEIYAPFSATQIFLVLGLHSDLNSI